MEESKVNGLRTAVKEGEMSIEEAKAVLQKDPMGKTSKTWGWLIRRARREAN